MRSLFKQYKFVVLIGVAFIATIIIYNVFAKTESFQSLLVWSSHNLIWFVLILTLIKIIGIVWPPLPGLVFTIGAIPIIGWLPAFSVDLVGSIIGSSFVFWLARRYGHKVILKIFGESGLKQTQRLKFNPHNELEALIIMRIFGGPVSELVSYGAGITNISFRNFVMGTLFSNLLVMLPLFYLAGLAFSNGGLFFGIIPLFIGILILYTLRKRYFILED